ncbi:hypothetical protein LEP1GSC199_2814 [Leptospira vanthielii serovar Holland str. Waz Holland = ATCC 700522]|uniref:Uncharacterized protein n=1 Tax=Leptospira vanthielii serovar Holland str. Waz Holland = ATCC 700522 TaxID=1218591 RepID=N1W382_9LEPT|nr:hypothetical protein LEP1GSC199_2814 [Leptospira vanthielii serovar Holland str. Waz Holland = ATCC 700522]
MNLKSKKEQKQLVFRSHLWEWGRKFFGEFTSGAWEEWEWGFR